MDLGNSADRAGFRLFIFNFYISLILEILGGERKMQRERTKVVIFQTNCILCVLNPNFPTAWPQTFASLCKFSAGLRMVVAGSWDNCIQEEKQMFPLLEEFLFFADLNPKLIKTLISSTPIIRILVRAIYGLNILLWETSLYVHLIIVKKKT